MSTTIMVERSAAASPPAKTMSASVWAGASDLKPLADSALQIAARFWFLAVVAGQWIFVAYVVAFYGGSAIRGDWQAWNRIMSRGHVPGHPVGNLVVALHLSLAVVILVGGPLQLIPQMRRHAPAFHHWNGRLYMLAVVVTSISGLYMGWYRGRADVLQQFCISLHAVLLMTFAALALRHAIAREISTHRRWALRLFMVVNAGLFFRVGLTRWILFNHNPIAFDPMTFTGPFLNVLSIADYLLPLTILEIYLLTKERAGVGARFVMTAVLLVLTVATGVGIFAAATVMWLPRM